jgi:hypothetical protein
MRPRRASVHRAKVLAGQVHDRIHAVDTPAVDLAARGIPGDLVRGLRGPPDQPVDDVSVPLQGGDERRPHQTRGASNDDFHTEESERVSAADSG